MYIIATTPRYWIHNIGCIAYKRVSKYAFTSSFSNFGFKTKQMLLPYLSLLGSLVVVSATTAELGKKFNNHKSIIHVSIFIMK